MRGIKKNCRSVSCKHDGLIYLTYMGIRLYHPIPISKQDLSIHCKSYSIHNLYTSLYLLSIHFKCVDICIGSNVYIDWKIYNSDTFSLHMMKMHSCNRLA